MSVKPLKLNKSETITLKSLIYNTLKSDRTLLNGDRDNLHRILNTLLEEEEEVKIEQ